MFTLWLQKAGRDLHLLRPEGRGCPCTPPSGTDITEGTWAQPSSCPITHWLSGTCLPWLPCHFSSSCQLPVHNGGRCARPCLAAWGSVGFVQVGAWGSRPSRTEVGGSGAHELLGGGILSGAPWLPCPVLSVPSLGLLQCRVSELRTGQGCCAPPTQPGMKGVPLAPPPHSGSQALLSPPLSYLADR